jgi:hypothetical protein
MVREMRWYLKLMNVSSVTCKLLYSSNSTGKIGTIGMTAHATHNDIDQMRAAMITSKGKYLWAFDSSLLRNTLADRRITGFSLA